MKKTIITISAIGLLAGSLLAQPIATSIDSITESGGIVSSVTVGLDTYNSFVAPTSLLEISSPADPYLALQGVATLPTDATSALGGLNVQTGALNYGYEAQFGGALTDTSQVFLIGNYADITGTERIDIIAIDASGNTLATASQIAVNANGFPAIVPESTYDRTGGTDLDRTITGATFTLAELGLGGFGATGIEISDGTYDPQAVFIAIPEPGTYAALVALGALLFVVNRRRRNLHNEL
ncbi:PEP-CTERM sorting domain-containing protein [Rubellicoccus peritrichatus]|uniref:PEP-CTERM sorting domain-containing protein n=1 Tax=Rubellicoccus peritrichatus TaxID=3080537 RepID=A0AAQ3LFF9_9BACT|nr:PEP-CTERM sorting domain-containing protein [Puniceicoccus sp. CR14]WOO43569.1 PEP-CTERM sorting domain-containing protein [Puniceicoccus sp. CR14]